MKNILFLLTILVVISGCETEPKNYVTLSGKITNKNSDSIQIKTRTYSKTIRVATNGTFSDTLKVETGVYSFYDGKEATSIFLKNGYTLNITLDTEMFDETVKFTGEGSEHSNFLAKKSLLEEELLDMDKLSKLTTEALPNAMNTIKEQLSKFYNSDATIDSIIIQKAIKSLDPMLKFYKGYIADAIALRTELYEGAVSPTFENYENFDGTTTSLSDLKGKYVYIDVWATWCAPCIAEIPALKKLETKYNDKDIAFVSLSIDDDRSHGNSWDKANKSWKAMVTDKSLGGIQLFAPKGWKSQFIQDYKIKGIPKFILIDPKGNVVTPNAPRPSNSKLITLFDELGI